MGIPVQESFEAFMARALHDPVLGYYCQGAKTVGSKGDFSTSATLLPELGAGVALWLQEKSRHPKTRFPIHVIEIGGGTGNLMLSILKSLGWWGRRKFLFHSVEGSGPLRKEQQSRLKRYGIQWHPDMKDALAVCAGRALIYSNEVVDAFPCIVLGFHEGQWKELYVKWDGKTVEEDWIAPGTPRLQAVVKEISSLCPNPKSGQRVEIPWAYREWLEEWLPGWRLGAILTIDYGDTADELFRVHRYGTLRAYFRQMRLEGEEIYRRIGQQDLTFDVNFTLVQKWGLELGLESVSYQSQEEFLRQKNLLPDRATVDPAHAMFRVLHQITTEEGRSHHEVEAV